MGSDDYAKLREAMATRLWEKWCPLTDEDDTLTTEHFLPVVDELLRIVVSHYFSFSERTSVQDALEQLRDW